MYRTIAGPGRYIQGRNAIKEIYAQIKFLGKRFALLTDEVVFPIIADSLREGFADSDGSWFQIPFQGDSTKAEEDRVMALVREQKADALIAAGGGKTIDTVKMVGNLMGLPIVIVPTAASSDAPCTRRSVVYDDEGTFVVSAEMRRNPDVVLVDTEIIAQAPVRFLLAGIGDAFSTFYEARACRRSGAMSLNGGVGTEAAYDLAQLCHDLLIRYGVKAVEDAKAGRWSEELEKLIEANIYISGVGVESNGPALAHAVCNGMTAVVKPFPIMHGEAVALGTIVQLTMENVAGELEEAVAFYKELGMPLKFEDLGITPDKETLWKIAEATCTVSPNAHKMPFPVSPEMVFEAFQTMESAI